MRRSLVVGLALAVAAVVAGSGSTRSAAATACIAPTVTPAYAGSVRRALLAKQDVWGNELLSWRNGPTYEGARRYLKPLLFARSRGKPLTASGVYYLPFSQPLGSKGASYTALHVADGSQILSRSTDGRRLTVYVGKDGEERFGSCLMRLKPARLAEGYLPILQTEYTDAAGVRYLQESFAVRGLGTRSLVSFVRVTADARKSKRPARVRFAASSGGLTVAGEGVRTGASRSSYSYEVAPGGIARVYAGWQIGSASPTPLPISVALYDEARQRVADFWRARLTEGTTFDLPERRVLDARQSLLIQNLALTWRYSVGNTYEEFSFAEALDVAEVMAGYGYADVTREMLRTALDRLKARGSNWRMGEKLIGTALYYRLYADRAYLTELRPALGRIVQALGFQILKQSRGGLLRKEQFSTDIGTDVYGLHSQAAAWQGLRAMAAVWKRTGEPELAAKAGRLATRLGEALRLAVRKSEQRLSDGSLFVPAALLDGHKPFDALTASRPGSYWNLVMPYALASGLFAPHGREATGILDYMLGHGSRLLGLVRAAGYSLYGKPKYPVSGTDQVYGVNVARFLADNDRPDQLVLSLYGMLAAGMTPDTYVSGEAATVAPLRGSAFRSMYLPPNGASNAAFLETLRLMLVHETHDRDGAPVGLQLAYATPRPWLGVGKRIAVHAAPTSFGRLSYELRAEQGRVQGTIEVPSRRPPRTMSVRLRLPQGRRLVAVRVDGRSRRFDAATGSIDLTGLRGTLVLVASVRAG